MLRLLGKILGYSAAGQALTLVSLPLATYLYSPADFGSFQIVLAFSNAFGGGSALSFERAFFVSRSSTCRQALRVLCTLTVCCMSIMASLFYSAVAVAYDDFPIWLSCCPVPLFVFAIVFSRGYYLLLYAERISGSDGFNSAARSTLIRDVVRVSVRLGMGLSDALNSVGLHVAAILDWTSGVLYLRHTSAGVAPRTTLPWFACKIAAFKLRTFPAYLAPASFLGVVAPQAPIFLIFHWFGAGLAGKVTLAFVLLDRPSRIFAKAVADLLAREFSVEKQPLETRRKKAVWISSIQIPVLLIVSTLVHTIGAPFLDAQWTGIGAYCFALVPHVFALFVGEVVVGVYAVNGQSRGILIRQLVSIAAIGISFALADAIGLSLLPNLMCLGVAHALVQLSAIVFLGISSEKNRSNG